MNTERWEWVKRLLDEAILVSPAERAAYLELACGTDRDLLHEVQSLLAAHEQAGTDFLQEPAADLTSVLPPLASRAGRRIGVYQIVEEIGHGGMGEVYRAVRADGQYTKQVAVKLVRGGYDSASVLERFRNERQILASLDHPNIARLLDGGTTQEGVPYLVMELIEGQPIDEYCDQHKLSVTDRLRLFRQVCVAVHYAHQRLVIHRDIKPSNILVTKEGDPKLLDFGIAKIVSPIGDAQTTMTRAMTPEYASPEQIRGEPITTATDVYSLGVVLYQLLTGRSPYPGETRSPHELARAVCETAPGRPSTVVLKSEAAVGGKQVDPEQISTVREGSPAKLHRRLNGDLDDIVLMSLRKESARRYGSVEQFAEDIRRHLEGLPVTATKGSWLYQTEKFIQRHRVAMAAAAIVILAVAGGIGATIREARIARANERRAENRFNDVRHLANSLIFEVDDAIANLPGSTSARKLMADDALKYLDTLAAEAKGDLTLQAEVARAYFKLGDIQGNPYRANLGETGAAIDSYRKALAIRESLVAANPQNRANRFALASSYEWRGAVTLATGGNLDDAMRDEEKALAILEPMLQADPGDVEVLTKLEGVYEAIGDVQGGTGSSANMGDPDAALKNHQKGRAIAEQLLRNNPGDELTRRHLADFDLKIGDDSVRQGDRRFALETYRKATDILAALSASSVNTGYARDLYLSYQRTGNAQVMDGDYQGGIKSYRTAVVLAQRMTKDDPRNRLATYDMANNDALLGNALAAGGDSKQGLVFLQRSITTIEAAAARDSKLTVARRFLALAYLFRGQISLKASQTDAALRDFKKTAAVYEASANGRDVDAQIEFAAANSKIADVLVLRGDSTAAIALYQATLKVVEPLAHAPHPLLQAQYAAADADFGLGSAFRKQATLNGSSSNKHIESMRQACSWFAQSSAEWQRIANPGTFSPTGFSTLGPGRVNEDLSSCNSQLKKLKDQPQADRH